ncbi:MAG TPA: hypothetical protein VHA09_08765 [Nitrososphaera sp.]|nr:hypothetical protein [Nitrososphaera sp.]
MMCNCPAMKDGDDNVSMMCPCNAERRIATTVLLSVAGFCAIGAGAILLVTAKQLKKSHKEKP